MKEEKNNQKKFLGVYFQCCHVYGRLYKNKEGNAYIGKCPKCLSPLKAAIGEGGTNKRFFRAK